MSAKFEPRELPRRRAASARLDVPSLFADGLTILVGLTGTFLLPIIGELPACEAILIASAPLLIITQGRRLLRRSIFPVFSLMALWFLGQVLSDIYRQTTMFDWMRGEAEIIVFFVDIIALLILLSGNQHRQAIFAAAAAVGSLLVAKFSPPDFARTAPWKFGYASGTITLVVLASCYFYRHRRFGIVVSLLTGIAAINLFLNYRSPVLILLITIALITPLIPERIGRLQLLPRPGSAARTAVLVAMALAAAGTASGLVGLATRSGLIGQAAQQKNEQQSQLMGGLLLGGRPEILASARAVVDSPLLGHGSWAKDYKYIEMLSDIEAQYDIPEPLELVEASSQGLIPVHSHLMGAWVWAGILGAVFWAYILWLTVRALIRISDLKPSFAPFYVWALVSFLWAIMFSPFGSIMRMQDAFVIVIVLDLLAFEVHAVGARKPSLRGPVMVHSALNVHQQLPYVHQWSRINTSRSVGGKYPT